MTCLMLCSCKYVCIVIHNLSTGVFENAFMKIDFIISGKRPVVNSLFSKTSDCVLHSNPKTSVNFLLENKL